MSHISRDFAKWFVLYVHRPSMIMEWRVINSISNYSSVNLAGINVRTAAHVGLGITSRPVRHTPTEGYIFISARRTNYLDK
jgi:hypothetical protein